MRMFMDEVSRNAVGNEVCLVKAPAIGNWRGYNAIFMAVFDLPELTKPPRVKRKQVLLIANGDLLRPRTAIAGRRRPPWKRR